MISLLEEKVQGKNWVGKQRFQYVKRIMNDMNCKRFLKMKELALNKEE